MGKLEKILGVMAVISLVAAGRGCEIEREINNLEARTRETLQQNTKSKFSIRKPIQGEIISVEESSFPIYHHVKWGGAGGQFNYETIKVRDIHGRTTKLLIPFLTDYQIGDVVEAHYKAIPNRNISFDEIVQEYGIQGSFLLQRGRINASGILIP